MKTARVFFSKVKGIRVALGTAMLAGVSAAQAALPPAAATAFTDMGTAIDDVETAVWPIVGASIVTFTIIKLVKRGASKV